MEKENNNQLMPLSNLIYPLFVKEEGFFAEEIPSMPDVFKHSLESLVDELWYLDYLGIKNILLFGLPKHKTWHADSVYQDNNFLCKAIEYIKAYFPSFRIFTDICLCAYTLHGHCGIVRSRQPIVDSPEKEDKNHGLIDGERTLKVLAKMAVLHARAGADFVAPSAMARGQVRIIRQALDRGGFGQVRIMAYSAKFASNFYGPFRNVADSAPRFGDRKGYQLSYKESRDALGRIEEEIREGADIIMVKPALAYLDIVQQVKLKFSVPLAVYNVSGEYAMAKLGASSGLWDEKEFVSELIHSFKRAGADYVISYHTPQIARWQKSYARKEKLIREQALV